MNTTKATDQEVLRAAIEYLHKNKKTIFCAINVQSVLYPHEMKFRCVALGISSAIQRLKRKGQIVDAGSFQGTYSLNQEKLRRAIEILNSRKG